MCLICHFWLAAKDQTCRSTLNHIHTRRSQAMCYDQPSPIAYTLTHTLHRHVTSKPKTRTALQQIKPFDNDLSHNLQCYTELGNIQTFSHYFLFFIFSYCYFFWDAMTKEQKSWLSIDSASKMPLMSHSGHVEEFVWMRKCPVLQIECLHTLVFRLQG